MGTEALRLRLYPLCYVMLLKILAYSKSELHNSSFMISQLSSYDLCMVREAVSVVVVVCGF